jgi:hypothetical protein
MKLKLIKNESNSNQFNIYSEPNREFIGTYEINTGDELELPSDNDGGFRVETVDTEIDFYSYYFESGSN